MPFDTTNQLFIDKINKICDEIGDFLAINKIPGKEDSDTIFIGNLVSNLMNGMQFDHKSAALFLSTTMIIYTQFLNQPKETLQ